MVWKQRDRNCTEPIRLETLVDGSFRNLLWKFSSFSTIFSSQPLQKGKYSKIKSKNYFSKRRAMLIESFFSKVCFWTETITKILAPLRVVCKWQLNTLIENVVRFLKVSQVSPVIEDTRLLFSSISRWQVKPFWNWGNVNFVDSRRDNKSKGSSKISFKANFLTRRRKTLSMY